MQVQRINITLPKNLLKQLDLEVPRRGRSKFIAKALEDKIGKKRNLKMELKKSLKANKAFYKREAKIWEVTVNDGLKNWPWEE